MGEPDAMFDKGIEAFGGISKFVKKVKQLLSNQTCGGIKAPTSLLIQIQSLLKRIVEQCFEAGAEDVYVFDNTCDEWKRCYENSGIEKAVVKQVENLFPQMMKSITVKLKSPEVKD